MRRKKRKLEVEVELEMKGEAVREVASLGVHSIEV